MRINDFPVRIKKKGKTRGRPSKVELLASEFISTQYKKLKVQNLIINKKHDLMFFGSCQTSGTEIQEALK